jgi:hypothetical protein
MKNLARRGGLIWVLISIIPSSMIISIIGKYIGLHVLTVIYLQIPLLSLQLFAVIMLIRYRKDIFLYDIKNR